MLSQSACGASPSAPQQTSRDASFLMEVSTCETFPGCLHSEYCLHSKMSQQRQSPPGSNNCDCPDRGSSCRHSAPVRPWQRGNEIMLHVIKWFVYVQEKGTPEPTFTATVQTTCEPTWKHVQQGTGRDRAEMIVQTKAAADLYVTIIHSESDDDTSVCEDFESLWVQKSMGE